MSTNYICSKCEKKHTPESLVFKCDCGGMLDLEEFSIDFSEKSINKEEWSLFRYIKALPFSSEFTLWKDISMGEGMTPIVPLDKENPNLLVKLDYLMPTMSFKDRGAAVLIAKAKELGVKKVIQDSSGNAGTSVAAYANRAGIDCDIYVPENTSPKKIKQIASHGAKVHVVPGNREDTGRAALSAVERGEGFYASHVYNPFFYQGTKTYAYEIYEQLKGEIPEALIIPVGNGTLVLGAYYGFKDLLKLGLIEKLPKIIAVQSQYCAPIYEAFVENKNYTIEVKNTGTLAEGIAIADPKRGGQILEAIRDTSGEIILAPEDDILKTRDDLALKGFYIEPTTASTFAGYFKYVRETGFNPSGKVIIPLCGSGLKSEL
ncbi:threonine synthase [Clostridium sp. MSJ-11]|uniref:Threonine synthase n=1 Tax=Clostridium mobile TaxID=2841512 RepID=A0ABS6EHP5_9CLOT|nr:threonine synthase [Clostridium mobile]MBU5484731.1 threonine synthase [Clostridium mobile]